MGATSWNKGACRCRETWQSERVARSSAGESVVTRVVRILDAFGPRSRALSVSEIARRADLPVATAHRLVVELVAHGLLQRGSDRRIRAGLRLWELGVRASPALGLREAAMPFMEDLHSVVRHHCQLGVLQDGEVLFVERLSAPGAVVNITEIAGRLPLHASSAGLVLLAHAPADLQERVLSGSLDRYTAHTITDPAVLRRRLADVRRQGYALCAGHIDPDATGVAVPVRGPGAAVVAALSVIVPNDGAAAATVPALMATVRAISRTLGPS